MHIEVKLQSIRPKVLAKAEGYIDRGAVFYVEDTVKNQRHFKVGMSNAKTVEVTLDESAKSVLGMNCTCGSAKPKRPCAHQAAALIAIADDDDGLHYKTAQLRIAEAKQKREAEELERLKERTADLLEELKKFSISSFAFTKLLLATPRQKVVEYIEAVIESYELAYSAFAKTLELPTDAKKENYLLQIQAATNDQLMELAAPIHSKFEEDNRQFLELLVNYLPEVSNGYIIALTDDLHFSLLRTCEDILYRKTEQHTSSSKENALVSFSAHIQDVLNTSEVLLEDDPVHVFEVLHTIIMTFVEVENPEFMAALRPLFDQLQRITIRSIELYPPERHERLLDFFGGTFMDYKPAIGETLIKNEWPIEMLRLIPLVDDQLQTQREDSINELEARFIDNEKG